MPVYLFHKRKFQPDRLTIFLSMYLFLLYVSTLSVCWTLPIHLAGASKCENKLFEQLYFKSLVEDVSEVSTYIASALPGFGICRSWVPGGSEGN